MEFVSWLQTSKMKSTDSEGIFFKSVIVN